MYVLVSGRINLPGLSIEQPCIQYDYLKKHQSECLNAKTQDIPTMQHINTKPFAMQIHRTCVLGTDEIESTCPPSILKPTNFLALVHEKRTSRTNSICCVRTCACMYIYVTYCSFLRQLSDARTGLPPRSFRRPSAIIDFKSFGFSCFFLVLLLPFEGVASSPPSPPPRAFGVFA